MLKNWLETQHAAKPRAALRRLAGIYSTIRAKNELRLKVKQLLHLDGKEMDNLQFAL